MPAAVAAASGSLAAGGCGAAGPSSWTRSLERALEEAAASGSLSLSGRKLRDYPRGSAAGHDLSDTTQADLSRNRLSELPPEACLFVSLESLNLYQNCIRYIPEAILNLQSLTFLNISRNQLSTLPVHLCNLPLKVLIASNNKLVSIPEEIGQLRQLMELKAAWKGSNVSFVFLPNIRYFPKNFSFLSLFDSHEDLYSSRPYGALDSGFNSVDSGDKRWSGNEPTDEFSDLPLRVAEITKEQRLRRESHYQEHRGSSLVTNGGVEQDLDQIDFIDSCATEEEEEEVRQAKCPESDSLSTQFMAYIEQRRISHEGSPVKPTNNREFPRSEDARKYLHQNR
ncbi:leucine-rich repeat and calponin homology domain-containing protein 3 [Notechis scutatus]|uniref:Leucine-rich repeat and calponin homology domain-containing protein 3 n=1 Tax=Notechis scutatus TaxID=8663 RepID=A0A6J1VY72_9SAUR|nr:leucine-rich repeat and calponin homology domain-containing protein 3 [Notechis scutatus]